MKNLWSVLFPILPLQQSARSLCNKKTKLHYWMLLLETYLFCNLLIQLMALVWTFPVYHTVNGGPRHCILSNAKVVESLFFTYAVTPQIQRNVNWKDHFWRHAFHLLLYRVRQILTPFANLDLAPSFISHPCEQLKAAAWSYLVAVLPGL